jgi:predicted ATPase
VLPLIVQALAAPKGSLTIAEQPEIHLNPRLQYLLADLFAEMASSDHRVIVETHSEHLLLRLRRLVASGKIGHEKVAIYFVEKRNGVSRIRHVPIQQNGHISSEVWPEGFFEESLRESLALAAAQSEQLHKN